MYIFYFLLFVIFVIAIFIKSIRGRNKKTAPGNKRIFFNKSKDIDKIFLDDINNIKCKDIIKK